MTILRNDGTGRFSDVSTTSGITFQNYPLVTNQSSAADFDGDGDVTWS